MRWLSKKLRMERNELILKLRAQGLEIKKIAVQTNLCPTSVEAVLYIARKKIKEVKHVSNG